MNASSPTSASLFKKIGIASLIMMASVFLSRVIGLVREMVIAWAGGARTGVDAYQVAFVLPEILNHIVASGFLSVTFIPIFSRYLASDRETEGWRVFSVVMTCFGGLLMLLIGVAEWFSPQIISALAPGITDPAVKQEAIAMTRIILPAQFFFFAGGLLTAVQFAKERFAIPALAPLIYNIGIIMGGVILHDRFGMAGFSWGVLAGAFAGNFVLQAWGARQCGMRFSFDWNFRHPDLAAYIKLTLPLMVGLTMTFSTEVFLKFFGSFLPEGGIAALNYSLRVMLMLVGFFGQAVGVASYPFMARLAAEDRIDELNRILNTTLRYLALVIPFSALMMALRYEIIRILFERGRFDAAATASTAGVLAFIMVGAFAFAAQTIVVRGFFAVQNTLFPAIYGTLAAVLGLPFYYFGMQVLGAPGIGLAVSLAATFQVGLLYILWNRKTRNPQAREVYRFILKISLVSVLAGALLEGFRRIFGVMLHFIGLDAATFIGSLAVCMATGVLFVILLVLAGRALGIQEISDMLGRVRHKRKRKKVAA